MSLLDRLRACVAWDPRIYRPFAAVGRTLGRVDSEMAGLLARFDRVFLVDERAVRLNPDLRTVEARTRAVAEVVRVLTAEGRLPPPSRRLAPVMRYWGESPAFYLESTALPAFGARAFGLAVTAYEDKPQGTVIYVARLAGGPARPFGKLDTTVDAPLDPRRTLRENLLEAAAAWAGIPERTLTLYGKATSLVSYIHALPDGGLANHAWFCFDLGPLRNFTPRPGGGPAEGYLTMGTQTLLETLRETEDFTRPAVPVLLDFLIRQGLVTPANQPDYQRLIQLLRLGHEEEWDYWHRHPEAGPVGGPPAS